MFVANAAIDGSGKAEKSCFQFDKNTKFPRSCVTSPFTFIGQFELRMIEARIGQSGRASRATLNAAWPSMDLPASFQVRRESSSSPFLTQDGWAMEPVNWPATRASMDGGELSLPLGPEIVNRIEVSESIEFRFPGEGLIAWVVWPELLLAQAASRSSEVSGLVSALSKPEPPRVDEPTRVEDPLPEREALLLDAVAKGIEQGPETENPRTDEAQAPTPVTSGQDAGGDPRLHFAARVLAAAGTIMMLLAIVLLLRSL